MKIIIFIISIFVLVSCENSVESTTNYDIDIKVAKWYNNHKAAITITCDIGWSLDPRITRIVDKTIGKNLKMDFEFVTDIYNTIENRPLVNKIVAELYPKGIHVFGHGHKHINHDLLSFDDAYASFKTCFDLMEEWGLQPRAYAYPEGRGFKNSTQAANRLAGFYCARGFTGKSSSKLFYMCPDNVSEPENWFFLPSIVVGDGSLTNDNVTTHSEMATYLNENLRKTAWVTILYHSIGIPGGYAYYPWEEYIKDLDYMSQNNFWVGNMDLIAAYIYERNAFSYCLKENHTNEYDYKIKFSDRLDNKIYNQPLTLNITIKNVNNKTEFMLENDEGGFKNYPIVDGKVTINILPNEKEYKVKLK